MAIENRDLAVGTKLVGRHRKTEHTCEVVQTEEGVRYKLGDGRTFKSPSSAASAVMGGVSANGWRFWSLEGMLPPAKAPKPTKTRSARGRLLGAAEAVEKGGVPSIIFWTCAASHNHPITVAAVRVGENGESVAASRPASPARLAGSPRT